MDAVLVIAEPGVDKSLIITLLGPVTTPQTHSVLPAQVRVLTLDTKYYTAQVDVIELPTTAAANVSTFEPFIGGKVVVIFAFNRDQVNFSIPSECKYHLIRTSV